MSPARLGLRAQAFKTNPVQLYNYKGQSEEETKFSERRIRLPATKHFLPPKLFKILF